MDVCPAPDTVYRNRYLARSHRNPLRATVSHPPRRERQRKALIGTRFLPASGVKNSGEAKVTEVSLTTTTFPRMDVENEAVPANKQRDSRGRLLRGDGDTRMDHARRGLFARQRLRAASRHERITGLSMIALFTGSRVAICGNIKREQREPFQVQ